MQADYAVVPEMLEAEYPWATVQQPERPDLPGPPVGQRRLQARLAPRRRRGDRARSSSGWSKPGARPPAGLRGRRHRQHGRDRGRRRAGEGAVLSRLRRCRPGRGLVAFLPALLVSAGLAADTVAELEERRSADGPPETIRARPDDLRDRVPGGDGDRSGSGPNLFDLGAGHDRSGGRDPTHGACGRRPRGLLSPRSSGCLRTSRGSSFRSRRPRSPWSRPPPRSPGRTRRTGPTSRNWGRGRARARSR